MPLTNEEMNALSHEERNAVWSREFAEEVERIRALLPAISAFFRAHDLRAEVGPSNGFTVVSTRPVSNGGGPGWVPIVWDAETRSFDEDDE